MSSLVSHTQDSGQHLSVIDDCNDHMLTVWDWQKKSKIAEIKVSQSVSAPSSPHWLLVSNWSVVFVDH